MTRLSKSNLTPSVLSLVSLLILTLGVTTASAQESGHVTIEAIASSSSEKLAAQHDKNAHFERIGGPLDGTYDGVDAIEAVWSKFAAARGDMTADVLDYSIPANPKGRTIIASILYRGEKTLPIRLNTTYRDDRSSAEIWQIDPKLVD